MRSGYGVPLSRPLASKARVEQVHRKDDPHTATPSDMTPSIQGLAGCLPLAGWLVGWQAEAHFYHWSLLILTFSKMSIKILNISHDV